MAHNNLPLEDAGRDYYARQFDDRVRNIRKSGAAAPAGKSGGFASRGAIGGGVIAVLVLVRVIFAVIAGVSESSSDSSYNNYNYTPQPIMVDPPPPVPDWNNGLNDQPQWPRDLGGQDQQPWAPPDGVNLPDRPGDPLIVPPVVVDPGDPPAVPDDGDRRPGKDD